MSTKKDELGDRMKGYELRETGRSFFQTLPIYARLDGRGFSKFTRGMKRPYDAQMSEAMIELTQYLVRECHARIGYTQSDEISLLWQAEDYTSDIFFKGKVQKMCSVLASMAAAKFNQLIHGWEPYAHRLPAFDCRILQLPNRDEAASMMLWRSLDGVRNAISMTAQSLYSHRELHGVNTARMLELIKAKGIDYEQVSPNFRFGTFTRREPFLIPATAHYGDEPTTVRYRLSRETYPLRSMTNRVEFLFDHAAPTYYEFLEAAE